MDEVIENAKKLLDDVAKTSKHEVTIPILQIFEDNLDATIKTNSTVYGDLTSQVRHLLGKT